MNRKNYWHAIVTVLPGEGSNVKIINHNRNSISDNRSNQWDEICLLIYAKCSASYQWLSKIHFLRRRRKYYCISKHILGAYNIRANNILNFVQTWVADNGLKLNIAKTKYIIFSNNSPSNININIRGQRLVQSEHELDFFHPLLFCEAKKQKDG
jgi:hypothetical protein